jgi:Fe-S cluster assembly protein SufD
MTTATTDNPAFTPPTTIPAALTGTGFGPAAVAALDEFAVQGEWRGAQRRAAFERFTELPMPSRKDEYWRFTALRGLDLEQRATYTYEGSNADPDAAATLDLARGLVARSILGAADYAGRIVTVNNAQRCQMIDIPGELPEGVVFCKLRHAMRDHQELFAKYAGSVVTSEGSSSCDDKFVALAESMADSGIFLYVPRGVKIEQPLHAPVVHTVDGATIQRRVLVVLEEGAEATFVEEFLSASDELSGLSNMVVELVAGQNSHLHYVTIQDWATPMWHLATHRVHAARDAQVDWTAIGLGASRGKSRMEAHLNGAGSSVKLTGAYFVDGTQQLDYDTYQLHAAPNASSDLAFKGVLDDKGHAIWRGMIAVAPGAQGTDAFQENRNLVLKSGAHADSVPGLTIEANDVRCTHASTTSKIDTEQLFYLQARGITREAATQEIVRGFYTDVLDRITSEQVRDQVREALWARIEGREIAAPAAR